MSESMKFPGRNTLTLCQSALMRIVENALNERVYDSKDPVRVLSVQSHNAGAVTVFDVEITTDKLEPTA